MKVKWLSLGALKEWCLKNEKLADKDDEPFARLHDIQYGDEIEDDDEGTEMNGNKFRFFFATKWLLLITNKSNKIHADATYKLNWQGFPVLIVATTDLGKKFHPTGLSICTEEKQKDLEFIFKVVFDGLFKLNNSNPYNSNVLLVDGSDAIRSAFTRILASNKMVVLSSHAKRCR